jgi:hypothetical protein
VNSVNSIQREKKKKITPNFISYFFFPYLHKRDNMGKYKKEASRIAREKSDRPANTRLKGENFYHDKKKVQYLNMLRGGKAIRDSKGKIVKAAPFQSKEAPVARIAPNRKWFGK